MDPWQQSESPSDAFPKAVLVLDDDEGFLEAMVRLLQVSGIDARGVRDLKGLTQAFPLPAGTCILADIMLIGESGLGVPDLLAANGQCAPVVYVSATDDEAVVLKAAELSGVPCLRKPVEFRDLLAALAGAMRHAVRGT
jgi:FixJ family two-component response regulator